VNIKALRNLAREGFQRRSGLREAAGLIRSHGILELAVQAIAGAGGGVLRAHSGCHGHDKKRKTSEAQSSHHDSWILTPRPERRAVVWIEKSHAP